MKKETAQTILELSQEEYNKYASEFSNSRQFFWDELKFLKDYTQKGDRVLDVGCGNGRLSDLLNINEIKYTGIDSSEKLIAIAQKERGSNGRFILANALELPFKNNSFDMVFSIATLHHIPSKENRMQFISEAHRVLRPGGMYVLTAWDTLQWKFFKIHIKHSFKKIFGNSKLDLGDIILPFGRQKRKRYIHSLTRRGLYKLFSKNDFSEISVQKIKRKSGHANLVVIAQKKIKTSINK